jgi:glycosyltransferase involved in cell wall biosynthesis
MNILQITREYPPNVLGGIAYHAYHLSRALVGRGHSVTVLTAATETHREDGSAFDFEGITVETLEYSEVPGARLWFDRNVRSSLRNDIDLDQIDAIHSHEYVRFGELPSLPPVVLKVHMNVIKKPEFWTAERFNPLVRPVARLAAKHVLWPRERALERHALYHSDYRVYISDLTKNVAESVYRLVDENHRIVHNGVDLDVFTPPPADADGEFFLYVGGDARRKGFPTLVDAVDARSDELDRPVKLVGDFDESRPVVQHAREIDQLDVVGRVDQFDLVGLYRRSAALVHPARYEPFGNVVLESLACGSPVVVSDADHCGAAELVTEETGELVSPDDTDALVDAMLRVEETTDPDACRAVAEGRSWDNVAEATLSLVE